MHRRSLFVVSLVVAAAAAVTLDVRVDTASVLARTSETRFASFSLDTTALFGVQRVAIPLTPKLTRLARNLAPSFFRVGGSYQDRAVATWGPQPPLPPPTFLVLPLNESVWDGVVRFADEAGLDLVYGLNAAVGRQTASGAPAPWLADNALAVVERAAALGQRLPVVELGNVSVFCGGAVAQAQGVAAPRLI